MKIYDTFIFFNELDLLEVRLHTLNEVVDKFVLVESTKTFQNKKKPLFFELNKKRFGRFLPKINHVVVEDSPDESDPWLLEAHQRNAIERGLINHENTDQIMISDIDEIPRPSAVLRAAEKSGVKMFRQKLFYYFFNMQCIELADLPWGLMIDASLFCSPQKIRNMVTSSQSSIIGGAEGGQGVNFIEDGGWHFSYLGGVEAIIEKIEAFSHREYNTRTFKDPSNLKRAIFGGVDLFGRSLSFKVVPFDQTFPEFVVRNQGRFRHLIKN